MTRGRQVRPAAFLAVAHLVISLPAHASSAADFAERLAAVLSAEQPCRLEFSQEGIRRFVVANVAPDDTEFLSAFDTQTFLAAATFKRMSTAELAAYCAQAEQLARAHGLLK